MAMEGNVEYGNKKQYFWNLVAILHMSLQLRWWHWEYRHVAVAQRLNLPLSFGSGIHIKKDSTFFWLYTLKPVFSNLKVL